jgi:glycosidase
VVPQATWCHCGLAESCVSTGQQKRRLPRLRHPAFPRCGSPFRYPFDLFRNSLLDNKHAHQWYAHHIVTMFDDHDQVGAKYKYRFCGDQADSYNYLCAALGLNLTTAGIPCIYYGTEQGFNGADKRRFEENAPADFSDAFLRECMFGGSFGLLQRAARCLSFYPPFSGAARESNCASPGPSIPAPDIRGRYGVLLFPTLGGNCAGW